MMDHSLRFWSSSRQAERQIGHREFQVLQVASDCGAGHAQLTGDFRPNAPFPAAPFVANHNLDKTAHSLSGQTLSPQIVMPSTAGPARRRFRGRGRAPICCTHMEEHWQVKALASGTQRRERIHTTYCKLIGCEKSSGWSCRQDFF